MPCYSWYNAPELYNAKRKTTGHNLQILTDQTGNITYISHPFSGKTHDVTALRATGILDTISPDHITADKGYYGIGCDIPIKKKPGQKHLKDYQRRFNHKLGKIRYVIEQAIANLKTWRILHTDNRAPLHHIPTIINTITKLLFYQPPE